MKSNIFRRKKVQLGLFAIIGVSQLFLTTQVWSQNSALEQEQSTWAALVEVITGGGKNLGSRAGLCLAGPGVLEKVNVIWSDRPLFLWLGQGDSFEVRLYSPFDPAMGEDILWKQVQNPVPVSANYQVVAYTGDSLEPGKSYDWEVFDNSDKSLERRTFQVMGPQERGVIAQELEAMSDKLRAEQATEEDIALKRAQYFVDRDLISDALQEVYSFPNPSAELIKLREEFLTNVCVPDAAKKD